ncbi:MAG: AAA family ATPase, partial [Phycisphaerae bacterium]
APTKAGKQTYPTPEAALLGADHLFRYMTADGSPVCIVGRYDATANSKKKILQIEPAPGSGWRFGNSAKNIPLYRLGDMLNDPGTVVITEGERKADLLRELGFNAVTTIGGAGKYGRSDLTPLAGRECVCIWPDHDDAGKLHADGLCAALAKLTPPPRRIQRIDPATLDLPTKGDAADLIMAHRQAGLEDNAITVQVEAIIRNAPVVDVAALATTPAPGQIMPQLISMADVEAMPVKWLWPERIAYGCITLLVGQPGCGKSFVTCNLAARISTGTAWPDGAAAAEVGDVLLIAAEDDAGMTIKPRLEAHNADCRRITIMPGTIITNEAGEVVERCFTLQQIGVLEQALDSLPECRLVIIDPIGSYTGGDVDSHRDNEVRSVLAPLAKLAQARGVAVLIVAHTRKGTGNYADGNALGSVGFVGIARTVWHLFKEAGNPERRLLLPGKNNLGRECLGLAFGIETDHLKRGNLRWEADPVSTTAGEAYAAQNMGGGGGERARPERDKAAGWLRDLLANGPMQSKDVFAAAHEHGIAKNTLDRAKEELQINPYHPQVPGPWWWCLPGLDTQHTQQDGPNVP